MTDPLAPEALMAHVCALADGVGPRPAGTPRERWAHDYVRAALVESGLDQIETLPFRAPRTWGWSLSLPAALALAGNFALAGRRGRLLGGLLSLWAARAVWQTYRAQRVPLIAALTPTGPSATQVARVPARIEPRARLVCIGHVDVNRHRLTFSNANKRLMRLYTTAGLLGLAANGLIQLWRAAGPRWAGRSLGSSSVLGLLAALGLLVADEQGSWTDGANDNATAVACLLGLAAHLKANPLDYVEVWFAFTGAGEVGALGTHALLDAHGETLRDAFFLDFEMVGAGDLAYVSSHGVSYLSRYAPDPYSAMLAMETARSSPEFAGVRGRAVTIVEEVGALRGRGCRGLCLVGVGADGFPVNWHRSTDTSANVAPEKVAQAARFGLAYAHTLDRHWKHRR